jgi:excisionase family DNA binding protein
MAGMFYSLKEVAAKLNKTEEQVKEIVHQGRLREFRTGGSEVLFKIDEVEALMSGTRIMAAQKVPADVKPQPQAKPKPAEEPQVIEDEIYLAPEAEEPAAKGPELSELSDGDTIASEGINVLGETDKDKDYQMAEDTLGETKLEPGKTAPLPSDETSLEKIEQDVNLDTFGSGSGLLDLSLQADDTSLGGILDEIYTPTGEGGKDAAAAGAEPTSAMDVGAETEHIISEGPGAGMEAFAMQAAYAEPGPDRASNIFGIMLILPLFVVIYTAMVTVAGLQASMPAILSTVQGLIMYVLGGIIVVALILTAVGFMPTGGPKTPKPPKEKMEKPLKIKTEKKAKEGKKK